MKRLRLRMYHSRASGVVAFAVAAIFLMSAFFSKPALGQRSSRPVNDFVTVNGVKLQYRDWGGKGNVLLFLTGLGGTVHDFDRMAPKFTDHFHVLGLTRRGQGESDKPPAGYDVDTLALDIKAFLEAKAISHASIVGYSIAGNEMTRLASLYPERVAKLVYLDAAYDAADNKAFLDKLNPEFEFTLLPTAKDFPEKSLAAIFAESTKYRPDYSSVAAPALSFKVVFDTPADVDRNLECTGCDESTTKNIFRYWHEYGIAWQRGDIDKFRREMKNGQVIELHETNHQRFMTDEKQQNVIVFEMRKFLLGRSKSLNRDTASH